MRILLACVLLVLYGTAFAVELIGTAVQGGLLFGLAEPGSRVSLDGTEVAISTDSR